MTEEQSISHAQYLDLVYSQSNTLYNLIPHASWPKYDPSKPPQAHSGGRVGLVKSTPDKPSLGQTSTSNSTKKASSKITSTPTKTLDVNVMQIEQSKNPPSSIEKKNKKKKETPLKKYN